MISKRGGNALQTADLDYIGPLIALDEFSRVAPQVDRCLGGQFACAPMSYSMFSTMVDVHKWLLGGVCGVCFGDE